MLDLVAVIVFVVVGRDEHQQTSTIGDILTVSAPFLIGVGVGTALAWAARHDLRRLDAGVIVLITTLVVGMMLRRWAWDRGTAATFVIVTAAFFALMMLGWRVIQVVMSRRRGYSRHVRESRT